MKCPHCGKEFESKYSTQIYCRPRCAENAGKKRYIQKHGRSTKAKARSQRRVEAHRVRNTAYVYQDKARGCSRCPERRPTTLDYHHVDPTTKESDISRLMRCGLSFEKLKAEMVKCILLCANCHRVEELGTGYTQSPNLVGDKEAPNGSEDQDS